MKVETDVTALLSEQYPFLYFLHYFIISSGTIDKIRDKITYMQNKL
jgi:hypothetical protein